MATPETFMSRKVIIAGPTSNFIEPEIEILRRYLDGGGRLFLLLDPSLAPAGGLVETGLERLVAEFGIEVGADIVVDPANPLPFFGPETIFVNIYGKTVEEYAALAERVEKIDAVAGIEVNISCPNVKAGGVAFGVDPDAAGRVVGTVRKKTSKTLIVKLSPNVTDITAIARRAEAEGADALSLINTITGMAIDVERRRPVLANVTGGLSGPAIKPVALRMVWQVAQSVKIPVIGVGGIMSAVDALEFMMVGATAIQVGTANFIDPGNTMMIIDGLTQWMRDHGLRDIKQLIGTLVTGD